jgi:hypothetical protein
MINYCLTGIVDDLGQYLWSSHKGYLSKAKEWQWLHKDFVFSLLTGEKRSRVKATDGLKWKRIRKRLSIYLNGRSDRFFLGISSLTAG